MPPKTEDDLPVSHKVTWLKASSAMELKNYGYVIQLLQGILKSYPDFLAARQMVRQAAINKSAGKKGLLGISRFALSIIKTQGHVKKDPIGALFEVEAMLAEDPYNAQINQLLKEAALAAKMPETAIFALETIVEGHPGDAKTLHELAKMYLDHALPRKAAEIYDRLLELDPHDLAAVKGSKNAAADESIQHGWDNPDSDYRNLLANESEAKALELTNRVQLGDKMIKDRLDILYQAHQKDQKNADTARKIAELVEQKGDFESAVEWYAYAATLTGNSDTALLRKASDLQLKLHEAKIARYEREINAHPDSEENPDLLEKLAESRRDHAEFQLEEARRRVDRNPTDSRLRYELGEIFMRIGNYKDAIAELQTARNNPNVRLSAMSLLGRCYTRRGMHDLAAKTLSEAARELSQMDQTKKDIVYNLGLVHEKMGQKEKAIECMKQIYEVDCKYLDVADRVEGSYDGEI